MTPNEARAMLDENRRLRAFVEYVMTEAWEGCDIDGGLAQDKAESLGLIELRIVNPEDNEWGADELYFLVWK